MKTWQWLGYLGLIPFLVCLWLFETDSHSVADNSSFNPQQVFVYYSAIILSFLSGALWRKESGNNHSKAQITSNVFCLYSFICLFLKTYDALIFLPLGYLGLLLAEYLLSNNKQDLFSTPYFIMRLRLTVLVILLHGTALVLWF